MTLLDPNAYTGYMLDVETDGLEPTQNSITSLALVEFDFDFFEFKRHIHFALKENLSGRVPDINTLNWREKFGIDKNETMLVGFSVSAALNVINTFIAVEKLKSDKIPVLFCKHIDFDSALLKGYFTAHAMEYPFSHKFIYDLDSIFLGMRVDFNKLYVATKVGTETQILIKEAHPNPDAVSHDALYDCMFQIELLRRACVTHKI